VNVVRLVTRNFGVLGTAAFDFGPGLNLIKGPNEAGKSTLVDALIWSLYADPNNPPEAVERRETWGSEGGVALSVAFSAGKRVFRIDTDFTRKTRRLTEVRSNRATEDHNLMRRLISETLGLVSADVFMATAAIRQNEVTQVSSGAVALRDRLEALVTGGGEDAVAAKAIEKIDDETGMLAGTDGRISEIERRRSEFETHASSLRGNLQGIAEARIKLVEIEDGLAILTRQMSGKREKFARSSKAAELETRQNELKQQHKDLEVRVRDVKQIEKRLRDIRGEIAAATLVDAEDASHGDDLATKLRFLEGRQDETDHQMQLRQEETEVVETGSKWLTIAVLTTLLTVGSVAVGVLMHIAGYAGAAFFGITSILAMLKHRNMRSEHRSAMTRLAESERQKEALGEEIYQTNMALKTILRKYGAKHAADLHEIAESYRELERESKALLRQYETCLEGRSPEQLEADTREVMQQFATVDDELREYRMYGLGEDELAMLKGDLEVFAGQEKELLAARTGLVRKIEAAEEGTEGVAMYEERIAALDREKKQLQRRLDVLSRAKEALSDARKGVIASATGAIEERASWQLSRITGGRYKHVSLDPHSLSVRVFSPQKNDWVDPQMHLSRGTVDQIYMVARLALVDMIAKGRRPFLVLDDPIVSFDDERAGMTLRLLREMASDTQILLMTCHDGYDPVANSVIALKGKQFTAPDKAPPKPTPSIAEPKRPDEKSPLLEPFSDTTTDESTGGVPGGFRL
jgi:DNA repair exonuclease SbcCD ATPase subunit